MRVSCHSLDRLDVTFDDERLVANAGLMLPATLAQHLGLRELFDEHVDLGDAAGRANVGHKAMTLVHSALAGGDSIDDADVLRAGDTEAVLGHGVLAPSTLGTFLRCFSWGHARQLDKVAGELLGRAWAAGAGPGEAPVTIDVDSTICETYGLAKQGGVFGHTNVRGYHPLLAAVAGTGDVVHSACAAAMPTRVGVRPASSPRRFNRVRTAGASGPLTLRADSGFYNHKVVDACRAANVRFSITAKLSQGREKGDRRHRRVRLDAHRLLPRRRRRGRDHLSALRQQGPAVSAHRAPGAAHAGQPAGACSPSSPTTPSSPTEKATRSSSRPTTAATPRSRTPSATSNTASA